jgi:hypothetical protein
MFESLKNLFNNKEDGVSVEKIIPAKVVMELDENGRASFQVEGRNKEICSLVGDLIASIAKYDKNNAKRLLDVIKLACNLRIRISKGEL